MQEKEKNRKSFRYIWEKAFACCFFRRRPSRGGGSFETTPCKCSLSLTNLPPESVPHPLEVHSHDKTVVHGCEFLRQLVECMSRELPSDSVPLRFVMFTQNGLILEDAARKHIFKVRFERSLFEKEYAAYRTLFSLRDYQKYFCKVERVYTSFYTLRLRRFDGDLFELISKNPKVFQDSVVFFGVIHKTMNIIHTLHETLEQLHGDIKLENFLFREGTPFEVVLADFEGLQPIKRKNDSFFRGTYTLSYLPPEYFWKYPYSVLTKEMDIYALGITWFMFLASVLRLDIHDSFFRWEHWIMASVVARGVQLNAFFYHRLNYLRTLRVRTAACEDWNFSLDKARVIELLDTVIPMLAYSGSERPDIVQITRRLRTGSAD